MGQLTVSALVPIVAASVLLPALALACVALLQACRERRDARAEEQRGLLLDALARADRPAVQLVCSTACTRDDLREAIRVVAARWLPRSQRMLLAETARASELPGVLRALLASEDGITRGRAAHLIGLLGVVDAACELEPLLDDRNPDVRLAAARAVGQLETREGARALIRALRSGTVEPDRLVEHLALPRSRDRAAERVLHPRIPGDPRPDRRGARPDAQPCRCHRARLAPAGRRRRGAPAGLPCARTDRPCRDRAPARRGARRRRLAGPGPGGTRADRPRGRIVRPRARAGALATGPGGCARTPPRRSGSPAPRGSRPSSAPRPATTASLPNVRARPWRSSRPTTRPARDRWGSRHERSRRRARRRQPRAARLPGRAERRGRRRDRGRLDREIAGAAPADARRLPDDLALGADDTAQHHRARPRRAATRSYARCASCSTPSTRRSR